MKNLISSQLTRKSNWKNLKVSEECSEDYRFFIGKDEKTLSISKPLSISKTKAKKFNNRYLLYQLFIDWKFSQHRINCFVYYEEKQDGHFYSKIPEKQVRKILLSKKIAV